MNARSGENKTVIIFILVARCKHVRRVSCSLLSHTTFEPIPSTAEE